MEGDFWLQRWRDGRTSFHLKRVTPLLQKFWPTLGLPDGSRVLVPLCGKSLDMIWLAEQGHSVLGIELSPLAVQQFFDENQLQASTHKSELGQHYVSGNIEIICGDIFNLDAATLSACAGVYDRAALIALPAKMRPKYTQHVYSQLANDYRGLLITLEYDQNLMNGPPFSVLQAEIQMLYQAHSKAIVLDRRGILDKEPKFIERGLTSLDTVSYQLSRKN